MAIIFSHVVHISNIEMLYCYNLFFSYIKLLYCHNIDDLYRMIIWNKKLTKNNQTTYEK